MKSCRLLLLFFSGVMILLPSCHQPKSTREKVIHKVQWDFPDDDSGDITIHFNGEYIGKNEEAVEILFAKLKELPKRSHLEFCSPILLIGNSSASCYLSCPLTYKKDHWDRFCKIQSEKNFVISEKLLLLSNSKKQANTKNSDTNMSKKLEAFVYSNTMVLITITNLHLQASHQSAKMLQHLN